VRFTKEHILAEIARTALANGGSPLGRDRFFQETGIKDSDWNGKLWSRWSDAVRVAGFAPNGLKSAYPEEELLARVAELARELGRFPVTAEMRLKRRADREFPNDKVFFNRFGTRRALVAAMIEYCRQRPDLADVAMICASAPHQPAQPAETAASDDDAAIGWVYLLKSGRHYKVGRSNAVGRRERELALQLPERATVVHSIKTDDPIGIENYWHRRFESRRLNGEWFALDRADLAAFKRRKFM
jgi:hypothetical protein